jgi:hypothetical protein
MIVRRIIKVMQGRAESIHRSGHGLENAMVNMQPALVGFEGGGAGPDFHLIPVIGHRLHNHPGIAPVHEVGRIGNPDRPGEISECGRSKRAYRSPNFSGKMTTLRRSAWVISAIRSTLSKSLGARQGNPYAVTGIGAVGQQVRSLYGTNSEVFDTEGFIFGKNSVRRRYQKGFGMNRK